MLNIRKLTCILVFLAILLVITPSRVSACRCFELSFWDSFTSASAVFTGKVIHIERAGDLKVTFSVLKAWKGLNDENLVVTTSGSSISCGIPFGESESDTFLVYAHGANDQLSTTSCSRTAPLSAAGVDILKLNVITHPFLIVLLSIATGLVIRGISLYASQKRQTAQ